MCGIGPNLPHQHSNLLCLTIAEVSRVAQGAVRLFWCLLDRSCCRKETRSMAKIVTRGCIGRQHPMLGMSAANIVERLNQENWRDKAVVRVGDQGRLYIWVSAGSAEAGSSQRYFVDAAA